MSNYDYAKKQLHIYDNKNEFMYTCIIVVHSSFTIAVFGEKNMRNSIFPVYLCILILINLSIFIRITISI
jgi:hypothetical protein